MFPDTYISWTRIARGQLYSVCWFQEFAVMERVYAFFCKVFPIYLFCISEVALMYFIFDSYVVSQSFLYWRLVTAGLRISGLFSCTIWYLVSYAEDKLPARLHKICLHEETFCIALFKLSCQRVRDKIQYYEQMSAVKYGTFSSQERVKGGNMGQFGTFIYKSNILERLCMAWNIHLSSRFLIYVWYLLYLFWSSVVEVVWWFSEFFWDALVGYGWSAAIPLSHGPRVFWI